jgi:putative oxidoreductase
MIKRYIFHTEAYPSHALNVGLFLFRVSLGLIMAFSHGLGKIPVKASFVGFVAKIGFPMPELFAWAAGLSELVGGFLVAIGLVTRLSSLSLAVTMAVAGFLAHASDGWAKQEFPLVYMICFLFIFFVGPGKYSIDGLISNKN